MYLSHITEIVPSKSTSKETSKGGKMEDGSLPSQYNANYISKEGEELFWNLGLLTRENSDGQNLNLHVAQVKYKNRTSIHFRNRPALPCYVSIYDGDIVIKFLKSLPGWNQFKRAHIKKGNMISHAISHSHRFIAMPFTKYILSWGNMSSENYNC